jgi:predicted ATPase/DNA-binding winged helix-turn-helix (wHTH) protein
MASTHGNYVVSPLIVAHLQRPELTLENLRNSESVAMVGRNQRPVYASRSWEIDLARRELRVGGATVPLGSRAFEILEVLVESAGELVSKGDLIGRVWQGVIVEENTLQFHISAIRKALASDREMLQTVSGRGYRLLGDWTIRQRVEGPHSIQTGRNLTQPIAGDLPSTASELIGRSSALQHLGDLASAHRVVTLSGPGGIGKSKLALELARCLLSRFEGDVWWVELASASKPDLVPTSVAEALGLKLGGNEISSETVARAIGDRRLLLVLDNCEHVIDAVARLTEALVSQCPCMSVLTTSREALRIEGEYIYRVPPLDVPPPQETSSDNVLEYSAVQLFIARAKALDDSITPTEKCLTTIAAICRRLDGIPLAIEFAAARTATLGPHEVASRLDDRFELLTSGHRTALPRHQTLRAALDWSYELLSEPEQRLLRGLAVFTAGFTLETAIAVMGDVVARPAVIDGVASLVAKSLVTFDGSTAAARWRLLETIRTYALEKLVESGEAEHSARRHAEFFLDLLGGSPSLGQKATTTQDMARCVRELDNIRAALDWAFSGSGDTAIGVVLTAACGPVWLHLSLMAECRERSEWALRQLKPGTDLDLRIRMQLALALGLALTYSTGSVDRAWDALSESFEVAEQLNDTDMQLRALWAMWSHRLNRGEHRATRHLAERFSQVAREGGDPGDVLVGDRLLGTTMHYEGRQSEARRHLERFLDLYVPEGNERHMMWIGLDQRLMARCYLARTLLLQGLVDRAKWHARVAFEDAQATGHDLSLCFYFAEIANPIAIMIGDLDAAARSVSALTELSTRKNVTFWTSYEPCLQAVLLIKRGEFVEGATLLSNSLETFRRSGNTVYYLALLGSLAEGLAGAGRLAEALSANDEAFSESKRDGQGWYLPELLRIRGELLLQDARLRTGTAAETCFLESIETARQQGALFWELRSALSLARLRLTQDRADQARQILAPICGQFTEGFETADLRAAREVLDSLGVHRSEVE